MGNTFKPESAKKKVDGLERDMSSGREISVYRRVEERRMELRRVVPAI
jgi:hypothetical protein